MLAGDRPPSETASDTYFFMWNLTDEGTKNPEAVREALKKASAMLRSLGGTCKLYVTLSGGRYELVGLAQGIDDTKAAKLLQAVNALGPLRTTTFLKTRDHYLVEYDRVVDDVKRLIAGKYKA